MHNFSAYMCVDNPLWLRARQAKVVSTAPVARTELLAGISQGIVEPLEVLYRDYGLVIATSLVHKVEGRILVYVMNPNAHMTSFFRGVLLLPPSRR